MNQLAAACLSFDPAIARPALRRLAECQGLLPFDRAGVTLHLLRAADAAGVTLRNAAEYHERLRKNRIRLEKRRQEAAELIALLEEAGLRAAVLKGFTLAPDFVPDAAYRAQHDLDLLLSERDARAAFDLLRARGFEPVIGHEGLPFDHLPLLLRKTDWQWRGDYFDTEAPAVVELHYRLWSGDFLRISLEFDPEPITRLVPHEGVPALDRRDRLAFCALHALRHFFRGPVRLAHIYEIAYFLHHSESSFWEEWRVSENMPLRRLCAAGFAMAARAFHCRIAPPVSAEMQLAPARARSWIELFGHTALQPERSNKAEVLLQLNFVEGWWDRLVVLQRRLLPVLFHGAGHFSAESASASRRFVSLARRTLFFVRRLYFHLRALPLFVKAAAEWARST